MERKVDLASATPLGQQKTCQAARRGSQLQVHTVSINRSSDDLMGGRDSTRWRGYLARETVERSLALNATVLSNLSLRSGEPLVVSWQTAFLAWRPMVRVMLLAPDMLRVEQQSWPPTWTDCIGVEDATTSVGVRRYFRCPGATRPCERRATSLYWPIFRTYGFRCRQCHRLAYASQRTSRGSARTQHRRRMRTLGDDTNNS